MEASKKKSVRPADAPAEERGEHGKVHLSWMFPEYPRFSRGMLWYLITVVVGAGLLLYALVSGNFLFALIILMFALVIYMTVTSDPVDVRIAITEEGIEFGGTFYPYKEIRGFWFIYEPPDVKNLYIDFKSSFSPRLTVDLAEMNPNDIRRALGRYVTEDLTEEDEPLSEFLGRVFKI